MNLNSITIKLSMSSILYTLDVFYRMDLITMFENVAILAIF